MAFNSLYKQCYFQCKEVLWFGKDHLLLQDRQKVIKLFYKHILYFL